MGKYGDWIKVEGDWLWRPKSGSQQQSQQKGPKQQQQRNGKSKPVAKSPPDPAGRPRAQVRQRAPPLSWLENGYQDPKLRQPGSHGSYAQAAARAVESQDDAMESDEEYPDTTAQQTKEAAHRRLREAIETAKRVKAAGCGDTEAARLDADVESKRRCVWVEHTELSEKLHKLDQKAGDLVRKIHNHPQTLQTHDDDIEAARAKLAQKIQERINYADKLQTWQQSLADTKVEIAKCKEDLDQEQGESTKPQKVTPAKASDGALSSELAFHKGKAERTDGLLRLIADWMSKSADPAIVEIKEAIEKEVRANKGAEAALGTADLQPQQPQQVEAEQGGAIAVKAVGAQDPTQMGGTTQEATADQLQTQQPVLEQTNQVQAEEVQQPLALLEGQPGDAMEVDKNAKRQLEQLDQLEQQLSDQKSAERKVKVKRYEAPDGANAAASNRVASEADDL